MMVKDVYNREVHAALWLKMELTLMTNALMKAAGSLSL